MGLPHPLEKCKGLVSSIFIVLSVFILLIVLNFYNNTTIVQSYNRFELLLLLFFFLTRFVRIDSTKSLPAKMSSQSLAEKKTQVSAREDGGGEGGDLSVVIATPTATGTVRTDVGISDFSWSHNDDETLS